MEHRTCANAALKPTRKKARKGSTDASATVKEKITTEINKYNPCSSKYPILAVCCCVRTLSEHTRNGGQPRDQE